MLLQELAETSGVSVASIKYYRREGLLPAGERVTATRQEYDRRHLERLRLVGTLREEAGASISDIRALVQVLDDPDQPLLTALEIAQAIALGLPAAPHDAPVPPDEDARVRPLLAELGWPDIPSGPRAALDALLRSMEAAAIPAGPEVLARYGRLLDELARGDLAAMHRPAEAAADAAEEPSDDVVVTRVVAGTVSYGRLAQVLRALGHASLSVAAYDLIDGGRPRPGR
ncbi:MerR family transcriptional regulator [Arsenicicoccus sp. oral taxon 190]|uniref:MerR family transcriptional regulator n=1 Tax=Arsenicicoccus sp. oral taxon 190 TaxID=1658671 RepID=UPI00067A2BF9|nr:MerR family transcriptional regulator [Arsenicicoccus sp. oral taxon 190]AKT52594.1 hypothetical protein ADJ73_04630 [Arsenicicoccus sp. oral taxon 190]